MMVRLILSIDRARGEEFAKKTIELLKSLKNNETYSKYVVGVDYSGNPYKNTFKNYIKYFEEAKIINGVKTAIHVAELPGE